MRSKVLLGTIAVFVSLGVQPAFADMSTTKVIAANCVVCHGPDAGAKAIPSMIGMPAADIEKSMLEFKTDKREATIMNRIAKGYDDAQIKALAEHFSKLKK
ncbi:MAG: c-type cytochrome [Thiotrichales bacterium]